MLKHTSLRQAFTVLEVLISIAIIGILTSVIVVNIRVPNKFADTREAIHDVNLDEIQAALQKYAIRYNSYPSSITSSIRAICAHGVSHGTCINLTDEIANATNNRKRFIAQIPQVYGVSSPLSGYSVILDAKGMAVVSLTYSSASSISTTSSSSSAMTTSSSAPLSSSSSSAMTTSSSIPLSSSSSSAMTTSSSVPLSSSSSSAMTTSSSVPLSSSSSSAMTTSSSVPFSSSSSSFTTSSSLPM
jgi:prepilin-type N-terminal cleavage/methylation domain-containing protein